MYLKPKIFFSHSSKMIRPSNTQERTRLARLPNYLTPASSVCSFSNSVTGDTLPWCTTLVTVPHLKQTLLQSYCLNFETLTGMCFETFSYHHNPYCDNQLHQVIYPVARTPNDPAPSSWNEICILCYMSGNTCLSWWFSYNGISIQKNHLPQFAFSLFY